MMSLPMINPMMLSIMGPMSLSMIALAMPQFITRLNKSFGVASSTLRIQQIVTKVVIKMV